MSMDVRHYSKTYRRPLCKLGQETICNILTIQSPFIKKYRQEIIQNQTEFE